MRVTSLATALVIGLAANAQAQTPAPDATATPEAPASRECATRFPIVLAEGLLSIAHFNVAETLRQCGATVFTTDVDPANTSLVRGPQLLEDIQMIRAMTGAQKVNLVAHSQGGLDARFILGTQPQVLGSIIQAGTPNLGSAAADLGQTVGTELLAGALTGQVEAIGGMNGTDINAAILFLTSAGAADFNEQFPLGLPAEECGQGPALAEGVALLSFGGTAVATNAADPSDATLNLGALGFNGQPSDGLVGRCSTHFGTVVRDDFAMNHIDLLNQVEGAIGADDPLQVYRMLAIRLKDMGL
jgi:triacylglycerol lipase